jgi:ketopantoate reductase
MVAVDYLIVGAGAMGMAFADVLLNETDATFRYRGRQGIPRRALE